jgi:hypothetical protein
MNINGAQLFTSLFDIEHGYLLPFLITFLTIPKAFFVCGEKAKRRNRALLLNKTKTNIRDKTKFAIIVKGGFRLILETENFPQR